MIKELELPLSTVCKNALKYYENKKLTAQHPNREERQCTNFIGEYRCAISASYPEEWKDVSSVVTYSLGITRGYIKQPDLTTAISIGITQYAHDSWAKESKERGEDDPITKKLEEKFVTLIKSGISA